MQYVKRMVEGLKEDKFIHLSTFPSSQSHPAFLEVLEAGGDRLVVHLIKGEKIFNRIIRGKKGLPLQLAYWLLFRSHWRSLPSTHRGELVEVPYLDYCTYTIGLLGSPFGTTPFQGVVMRPDFHWQEMGVKAPVSSLKFVKKWLFLRLLRNRKLEELVSIDPSLVDWIYCNAPLGFKKIRYMEDPSDLKGVGDRWTAIDYYSIPMSSKVILLFGAIDERKGVRALLDLMGQSAFQDCIALIVGQQSNEVRRILRATEIPAERLICADRYVDSQEEWLAFQAADYVWLAYDNFFGPSGVLSQARQVNAAIIYNGMGLIGYSYNMNPFNTNSYLIGPT